MSERIDVTAHPQGNVQEQTHALSEGTDTGDQARRPVTAAEVEAIVRAVVSEMKVYVLESDITEAQNAVRALVGKSRF